jgi:hypothetical protein
MKADSSDYGEGVLMGRKRTSKAALAAEADDDMAGVEPVINGADLPYQTPACAPQGGRLGVMQNGSGPHTAGLCNAKTPSVSLASYCLLLTSLLSV